MTSEEFYGHFMGLLAGPKGPEIASQVLRIVLETNPRSIGEAVGEIVGEALGQVSSDVLTLQMYAHLNGLKQYDDKGKCLDPKASFMAIEHRLKMLDRIRERLREEMRDSEQGRAAAEAIMLSLD